MRHIQPEPFWGGSTDSAGPLRAFCALALVQCREVDGHRLLIYLTPLFADKELSVRLRTARAIEHVGTDSAVLLLRLRAELGSDVPDLLGACYSGVLTIEGDAAIPWVAQFLPPEDNTAAEAALAIAQTHTAEAVHVLRVAVEKARDPWFRTTLLTALGLTRQQEALDWLLDLVANEHVTLSKPRKRFAALRRPRPLSIA